jgi:hypothetical protein
MKKALGLYSSPQFSSMYVYTYLTDIISQATVSLNQERTPFSSQSEGKKCSILKG